MSAGPDKKFDMFLDTATALSFSSTTPPNFPYAAFDGKQLGVGVDVDSDGSDDSIDNITNHLTVTR